jgi:phosphoribosylformimino-5-aminoimidazole carboxamide ribotide isomerase
MNDVRMEIIPAIDLIGGKCVRLTQGDYEACKVYADDPLEVARRFEAAGIRRLHVVDLDGARSSGVVNIRVLERICAGTCLSVDFGGGIKSDGDLEKVFAAGADFACIGSLACADRERTAGWLEHYGRDRIIVGADVRNRNVCTHGWQNTTETSVGELAEWYGERLRYLLCTDISKDGMLGGPAVSLYRELQASFPDLHIIASGGVGSAADLEALEKAGLPSVVVGKALYEQKITLEELAAWAVK